MGYATFAGDRGGAAAIEFALLALPLFMLVFGIAETGFDLYCTSVLEVAAHQASRQIQVGSVQQGNLDRNGFDALACGYLPSFLRCSNLAFSVQTVTNSFYDLTTPSKGGSGIMQYAIRQPSLDQAQNTFCPGPSNAFVVVQFLYAIPALTGIWLTTPVKFKGGNVRVVSATEVFRNESFTASNTGAGC